VVQDLQKYLTRWIGIARNVSEMLRRFDMNLEHLREFMATGKGLCGSGQVGLLPWVNVIKD